jgi:hypothetical protein
MTEYLTEFQLDSSATLASESFEISPASGLYRATFKQLSAALVGRTARLRLQVFHSAASFDEAETAAGRIAVELVEVLTMCTSSKFEQPEIKRQIDWSEGVVHRQAAVYTQMGELAGPDRILDDGVAATVALMAKGDNPGYLSRAIYWYREGIKALSPDAKVQAFWLCLETLISGSKALDPVVDKCVFCQSAELACRSCGRTSKHMPFPSQRIKLLLREVLKDAEDSVFKLASKARNEIMHGGSLVARPGKKAWDLAIVSQLGDAAWQCVTREIVKLTPGKELKLWKPSTYLSTLRRIRSRVWAVVPLINGKPDPDNIPDLDVSVIHKDGTYLIKQSASGAKLDLGGVDQMEEDGSD